MNQSLEEGQMTSQAATGPSVRGRRINPARSPRKVIVVGAGLAGLSSAYELVRQGHTVSVLEARDRLGGRIETLRRPFPEGVFAEAGAYWLNDKHTIAMGYIEELGLKSSLREVPLEKNYLLYHIRGRRVEAHLGPMDVWPSELKLSSRESAIGLGAILGSLFCDKDLVGDPLNPQWPPSRVKKCYEKMNFLEFLRSMHRIRVPSTNERIPYIPSEGAIELIRPWFAWWDDMDKLSALAMIRYGIVGQRLCEERSQPSRWFTSNGGMDAFPNKFAETLTELGVTIQTNAPVMDITQTKKGATVTFRSLSGDRHEVGDFVICAVPATTLANINITPPLSESKQRALRTLSYASVARAYVHIHPGITDLQNGAGYTDRPIGNLLDMSFGRPDGPGTLIQGFMIGSQAKMFASMTSEDKKGFVWSQLLDLFPQLKESRLESFAEKCWDNDPWALGAYPLPTPHSFSLLAEIAKPEGRLHFAGEHTSIFSAWMEGALQSGCRAAIEIDSRIPDRTQT
jgi:monoamine oxidase